MSNTSNHPSRREVITGLGAALGMTAVGCGADAGPGNSGPDGAVADAAPPEADPHFVCNQPSSLGARELLAHIDTFVVLCMENRSFDHYLGAMTMLEGRTDIQGLTGRESNPGSNGQPVPVHVLQGFSSSDPPHGWDACHRQWNGGRNDGFVREHAGASEAEVMGYYTRSELPMMYALADGSAICHQWYAAVMGPTWPNRFYLHGATSRGRKSNASVSRYTSIFDRLDDAGISHTNYFHDVAWATGGYFKLSGLAGVEKFFTAAERGTLPQFCVIDPKYFGAGANDDHPDHDVRMGQALISSVFQALAHSPQWERCLLVVTYDEHGGFYDHVSPPTTEDANLEFRQLGFRVPSLVAGPTVRRGCAVDTVFEHTSVIATLTRRFDLEPLNDRVSATNDLSVCIDPALIGRPLPPPAVPPVELPIAALTREPPVATHPELTQALAAQPLPRHLDRRGRDREITGLWLEHARRLGAVRVVD